MINGKVSVLEAKLASQMQKVAAAKDRMQQAQSEYETLRLEEAGLREALEAAQTPSRISDHAVLRYLERVYGFDLEATRNEIAEKSEAAIAMGASAVTVNGVKFKIRNNVVTTVVNG